MKHFNLILVCVVLFLMGNPLAARNTSTIPSLETYSANNVSITIDSKTSKKDFESITLMLEENGIITTFSNIKRNEDQLITSIKITLRDTITNNKTVSNSSSNSPINKIFFGRKNGGLFVTQSNRPDPFVMNSPNHNGNIQFSFDTDSIMNQQLKAIKQMFNEEDSTLTLNGYNFNFDNMRKKMQHMFDNMDNDGNKSMIMQNFGDHFPFCGDDNKYKFDDAKDIKKHIVINGRASNYTKLSSLAKQDELESVDHLKPKTAKSIYGEKGKFGAIIATTK